MNVQQKAIKRTNGFTIIEVVLVLAIAGLIFLMVFIALPALQASQRDTARKNDVSAIASTVTTYTSNNRGNFPTANDLTGSTGGNSGVFVTIGSTGYVSTTSVSTNTDKLEVQSAGSTSAAVSDGEVTITPGTQCGSTGSASAGTATESLTTTGVSARSFTVVTYIEAGGGSSYCQDS